MRFVTLIFCFVLMLQAILPCPDSISCFKIENDGICRDDAGSEEKSDHEKMCSPFCQCACCSCIATPQRIAYHIQSYITLSPREYADVYVVNLREVFIPIWQPPKI